jgi:hypothetical protein
MVWTSCNIKRFSANIHKAKAIRRIRFHPRTKRQYSAKSDDDPTGRALLDKIVFAAEFTNFSKLGRFCLCAFFTGCRSPPRPLFPELSGKEVKTDGQGVFH